VNDLRPRQRRSRRERQADTREALLGAAARVFAERGFAGASLDEIAERAGYTRGAVYANFADKDDLFLTLVERHKDAFIRGFEEAASLAGAERRLAAVRELLTGGPPGIAADWIMLWTEFWLHAVRRPDLAARLADHERRYRAAVARLLGTVAADLGLELPGPAEELAAEVIALDVGLSLQARLAPELGPGLLPRAIARLLGIAPAASEAGTRPAAGAATAGPAAGGPAPEGDQP
jgi:AcrR family transcriptional regulator